MHIDLDYADVCDWDLLHSHMADCRNCEDSQQKIKNASYWLKSIVKRISDGEALNDLFFSDMEELCHILGVVL